MSTTKYRSYNLPGFGIIRVRLYDYPQFVFDFLDNYEHLKYLQNLDQLGPIRQILPGAHHTRYEYLMAQLAIITELCHLRGQQPPGLSLQSDRRTFGVLPTLERYPTNGEILMILAFLGNIGHLHSTFSGERALIQYLRDHAQPRRAFNAGLPAEDRADFARAIELNKLYQFNYFIAAFLLNRYRRRSDGNSVVDLCQAILRSFRAGPTPDDEPSVAALWRLYRNLRRLTYVALDSHYAPVPFSLDLRTIFFSLDHFLTDVFGEESSFQDALHRLDGVMRDTVYMGPAQLINHARVGDQVLQKLEEMDSEPSTITSLWMLLGPDREAGRYFDVSKSTADRHTRVVQLSFDFEATPGETLLPEPIIWERRARERVGTRAVRFAADLDPQRRHLKVSAALAAEGPKRPRAALRTCKQLIDFENNVYEHGVPRRIAEYTKNGIALLRFVLPAVLGEGRRFRLPTRTGIRTAPVIRTYGSTRAAEYVADYRREAAERELFDADGLNEVAMLERTLREIDYRGAVLAFSGSTEVIEGGEVLAEFDGLILLLSRAPEQASVIVVEAKNTTHGHTAAERQLRAQRDRLGIAEEHFHVIPLRSKGAFAEITVAEVSNGS